MKRNTEANRQNIREQLFVQYAIQRQLNRKNRWTDADWETVKTCGCKIRQLEALLGARG